MSFNPIAYAWRTATSNDEMALAYAAPFHFIDNRGQERECTCLIPHLGSPMGTLISTRYDPDYQSFIASVRGLGYYAVTQYTDAFETYDRARFLKAVLDWGWYGPEGLLPTFFEDDPNQQQGP